MSAQSSNAQAQGTVTVKQWNPHVLTFTTDEGYAWKDFPLQVTFTNDSTSITLDGYWDGDRTWRVRFAPTELGRWTWKCTSADDALCGKRGSFTCVPPTAADIARNPNYRGHIRVSNSGRFFTYADGTPFFLLADTIWHVYSLRCGLANGNFETYLNNRKTKGFNALLIQYFSLSYGNEGGHAFLDNITPKEYGDNGNKGGGNGHFEEMNPAFWQSMDERMQRTWEEGFTIAGHPNWISDMKVSLENASLISRYMLARYGAYNIIWSLSGEYSKGLRYHNVPWDSVDTWNALGYAVRSYNRRAYDHPLSVHACPFLQRISTSVDFGDQQWLDHDWLQTGQRRESCMRIPEWVESDWRRKPRRPVFMAEGWYERTNTAVSDFRWQAWVACLCGACAYGYGAHGIWNFLDPDDPNGETGGRGQEEFSWRDVLDLPGSSQVQYVRKLLESTEW